MAVSLPVNINKNNCSFGYFLDWDEIEDCSRSVMEALQILQSNGFKYCVTVNPRMELKALYELAWTHQKVFDGDSFSLHATVKGHNIVIEREHVRDALHLFDNKSALPSETLHEMLALLKYKVDHKTGPIYKKHFPEHLQVLFSFLFKCIICKVGNHDKATFEQVQMIFCLANRIPTDWPKQIFSHMCSQLLVTQNNMHEQGGRVEYCRWWTLILMEVFDRSIFNPTPTSAITPQQYKISVGVVKKDILRGSRIGSEASSMQSDRPSHTSRRRPSSIYLPSDSALQFHVPKDVQTRVLEWQEQTTSSVIGQADVAKKWLNSLPLTSLQNYAWEKAKEEGLLNLVQWALEKQFISGEPEGSDLTASQQRFGLPGSDQQETGPSAQPIPPLQAEPSSTVPDIPAPQPDQVPEDQFLPTSPLIPLSPQTLETVIPSSPLVITSSSLPEISISEPTPTITQLLSSLPFLAPSVEQEVMRTTITIPDSQPTIVTHSSPPPSTSVEKGKAPLLEPQPTPQSSALLNLLSSPPLASPLETLLKTPLVPPTHVQSSIDAEKANINASLQRLADLQIQQHASYQNQLHEYVKVIISEIRAKDPILTDIHSLQLGQSSASLNLGVMVEEVLRAQTFLTPEFKTRAAAQHQESAALASEVQKGEKQGQSGSRGNIRIGSPVKDKFVPSSAMVVQDPSFAAALTAKRKFIEEAQAAKRQRTDQSSSSTFIGQPSEDIYAAWKDISSSWPPTPRIANEFILPSIPDICLEPPTSQDQLDLQKSGMTGWQADMLEALQFWNNLPSAPPKPTLNPGQRKTKKYFEAVSAFQDAFILNQKKSSRLSLIKNTLVKAGFSLPEDM